MLEIRELNKYYKSPLGTVQALKNVNLQIPRGGDRGIVWRERSGQIYIV